MSGDAFLRIRLGPALPDQDVSARDFREVLRNVGALGGIFSSPWSILSEDDSEPVRLDMPVITDEAIRELIQPHVSKNEDGSALQALGFRVHLVGPFVGRSRARIQMHLGQQHPSKAVPNSIVVSVEDVDFAGECRLDDTLGARGGEILRKLGDELDARDGGIYSRSASNAQGRRSPYPKIGAVTLLRREQLDESSLKEPADLTVSSWRHGVILTVNGQDSPSFEWTRISSVAEDLRLVGALKES